MSVGRLNTSGASDTTSYLMGRGKLYISALVSGLPEEWRDLGNIPEFTVNVETEDYEHFSSRSGLKTLDLRLIISQICGGSFQMEELSAQNLGTFLSANTDTPVNPAVAGISEYLAVTAVSGKGVWIDIQSGGIPARDIDASDVTVIHDKASANDTLVLNTDYSVDTVNGRIFLLSTGSTVLAGKTIHITLAAKAGAVATLDKVEGLQNSASTFALKFVGENPADDNKEFVLEFHKVRLLADGDLSMITDELANAPISFAAEVNETWPDSDSQVVTLYTHAQ